MALRPKSVRQHSAKDLAIMLFCLLWSILAVLDYFGHCGLFWLFWAILAVLGYFARFGLLWLFGPFASFWAFFGSGLVLSGALNSV